MYNAEVSSPGSGFASLFRIPRGLWVPALVGIAIAASFIALRNELRETEDYHLFLINQSETERLRHEFATQLEARRGALTQFAAEWAARSKPSESDFRTEAQGFLALDLSYRAIEWREPSLVVRAHVPSGARLPNGPLDPQDDALRMASINTIEENLHTSVPSSIPIHDGSRQVLVTAPMTKDGRKIGYLVGVMRLHDLIDHVVRDGIVRGFEIAAYEGPFQVFGPPWEDSGHGGGFWKDTTIRWGGLTFTFKVWPSEDAVKQIRSPAADLVLALGLVLALSVPLLIHRLDSWRRRARAAAGEGETAEPAASEEQPTAESSPVESAEAPPAPG